MKERVVRSVLVCMGVLAAACDRGGNALVNGVNEQWPAVDRVAEESTALGMAEKALVDLGGPDLYLNVETVRITDAVSARLSAADEAVQSVEAHTANQALVADVSFKKSLDAPAVNVEGKAQFYAYPQLDGATLRFAPAPAAVELTSAKVRDDSEVTAEQLAGALATFVTGLGQQLAELGVALDYAPIIQWEPTDWLQSIPGARDVSGQKVALTAKVAGAAIVVDEAGAHVLTDFVVERRKRPVKKRDVPPEDLAARFEALRSAFRARVTEAFGAPDDATWAGTSAAFTSEFIANSANLVLAPVSACATVDVGASNYKINQQINLGAALKLQCEQPFNERACRKPPASCEKEPECKAAPACERCAWYDVDCHAARLSCETGQLAAKPNCKLQKFQHKAQCAVGVTAQNAACEVQKAAKGASCKVNQDWLDKWNGVDIGRATGNVSMDAAPLELCLAGGLFSPDLRKLTLEGKAEGRTAVHANLAFKPKDARGAAVRDALAGQDRCGGRVFWRQSDAERGATGTEHAHDGATKLRYQLEEAPFGVTTNPRMGQILTEKSGLAIACKPAVAVAGHHGWDHEGLQRGPVQGRDRSHDRHADPRRRDRRPDAER